MKLSRTLSVALALLLLASESYSGVWRVAPIRVDLDRSTRSTVVRVSNSGSDPVRIQVNTVAWAQTPEGDDIYSETSDLLAFPKIATIKPNENQIIRVGIKRPALQTEKTYRLFIQEIPPATPEGGASVAVALRVGIPVFAAPLQPSVSGSLENISLINRQLAFSVNNSGNITNKMEQLVVTASNNSNEEIFKHEFKPWYLLPGTRIIRNLNLPKEICERADLLHITAQGDKLKLTEKIPVSVETCR